MPPLDVIYEDNHLLVINKPAGWPSAHSDGGAVTLHDLAREYLKAKYHKPGNVYLGVVHRLDKPVSGVLLFARTSKAAARVSEQFRDHTIRKTYLAICERPPASVHMQERSCEEQAEMQDYLWHDDHNHIVKVVEADHRDVQHAVTEYRVLNHTPYCVLQLSPRTGRRHQLRVQLASRGAPILGDRKYGSRVEFEDAIALHARTLVLRHPITGEPLTITAEFPNSWRSRFAFIERMDTRA